MSLNDVCSVAITASSVNPSRPGFGTQMFVAYHSVTAKKFALYGSLAEVVSDGFATTSPVYKAAVAAFSQNPRPERFAVGKRAAGAQQIIRITPVDTTAGHHYTFSVVYPNGTVLPIDYVILGGATVATICTALAALINAATPVGMTVTASATYVQFATTAAGDLTNLTGLPNPSILTVKDTTADAGIAADLAAIYLVNSTDWYGVSIDSNAPAENLAAMAWVEANGKIMVCSTCDSACVDGSSTTDIMYVAKGLAYARSDIFYLYNTVVPYLAPAFMGSLLPSTPGASIGAFRTLAGVPVDDTLTQGQTAALDTKKGNYYMVLASINLTMNAWSPSGEFLDIVIFIDWMSANLQIDFLAAAAQASANNTKIPYTDKQGGALVYQILDNRIKAGIAAGGLADSPTPIITILPVAQQQTSDRISRKFRGARFQATLAGAIQSLVLTGVIAI